MCVCGVWCVVCVCVCVYCVCPHLRHVSEPFSHGHHAPPHHQQRAVVRAPAGERLRGCQGGGRGGGVGGRETDHDGVVGVCEQHGAVERGGEAGLAPAGGMRVYRWKRGKVGECVVRDRLTRRGRHIHRRDAGGSGAQMVVSKRGAKKVEKGARQGLA